MRERPSRVVLVTIDYPPLCTSAAVQMHDLALEMRAQGHSPTVIVPSNMIKDRWKLEQIDGIEILWIKAPPTRDIGLIRRAINEARLAFIMRKRFLESPLRDVSWDLIVWYSPTIFFGFIVQTLKHASRAPAYLILRDIFPEWAVDLGLMRKGLIYAYFQWVAQFQYNQADVIGVQSISNCSYFSDWSGVPGRTLEVLPNWQRPAPIANTSIDLATTTHARRTVFAYIGNMGLAQGSDILIDLAESLLDRPDIGFVFVGRGSEKERLKAESVRRGLTNTLFFAEISPKEIPGFLAQCHVGLVTLDPRHKSHNVPGKFVSYLNGGLPVLCRASEGSDILKLIEEKEVGFAVSSHSHEKLRVAALKLAEDPALRNRMSQNARHLASTMFSPENVVRQVMSHARSDSSETRGSREWERRKGCSVTGRNELLEGCTSRRQNSLSTFRSAFLRVY